MTYMKQGRRWKFEVDTTEWAFLLFVHGTPGMVSIHILCFSLVWWLI